LCGALINGPSCIISSYCTVWTYGTHIHFYKTDFIYSFFYSIPFFSELPPIFLLL